MISACALAAFGEPACHEKLVEPLTLHVGAVNERPRQTSARAPSRIAAR